MKKVSGGKITKKRHQGGDSGQRQAKDSPIKVGDEELGSRTECDQILGEGGFS